VDIKGFFSKKPVIGVVHLPPLPGSPDYMGSFEDVLERAVRDVKNLVENGVDAIIVENFMDTPYSIRVRNPETIAAFSIISWELKKIVDCPIGLNLLRNSGPEAYAIACIINADFIRVNALVEHIWAPEGLLTPVAREIMLKRRSLNCYDVAVFADVNVKHGKPVMDLDMAVREAITRGKADAVIVTGKHTSEPPDPSTAYYVKSISDKPVVIGSGITPDNIRLYWDLADGFIVGTYFKVKSITTNPVDPSKVRRLMTLVNKLRKQGS